MLSMNITKRIPKLAMPQKEYLGSSTSFSVGVASCKGEGFSSEGGGGPPALMRTRDMRETRMTWRGDNAGKRQTEPGEVDTGEMDGHRNCGAANAGELRAMAENTREDMFAMACFFAIVEYDLG